MGSGPAVYINHWETENLCVRKLNDISLPLTIKFFKYLII